MPNNNKMILTNPNSVQVVVPQCNFHKNSVVIAELLKEKEDKH